MTYWASQPTALSAFTAETDIDKLLNFPPLANDDEGAYGAGGNQYQL